MFRSSSKRLVCGCSSACLRDRLQGEVPQACITYAMQVGPSTANVSTAFSELSTYRSFQSSVGKLKALEVKIQSMGESISEGTVAAVLKQAGEPVEEDEPILQIETDKVTIDVRAPEAGKLENLLVKADDTVTTGQLVATIAPGEEGSQASQPAKEEKPGQQQQQPKESAKPQQAPQHSQQDQGQQQHRQPSIRFPKRRLPDGTRISDLPLEEQQRHKQEQPQQAQQTKAQSQAKGGKPPDSPPQRKSVLWYVGKEQGTKMSQSRVLTDREMEQIELGGA